MKKLLFSLASIAVITQAAHAETHIRYNLAGYFPDREKVAIVMSDNDLQGKQWTIKKGGETSLNGTFGKSIIGKSRFTTFPYHYEVDFSSLQTLGDYLVHAPGTEEVKVSIKHQPYGDIANQMLRALRVSRSGTGDTLDHARSHMGDAKALYYRPSGAIESGQWAADPSGKTADMLGGWYDAGDYIKFTLTIAQTTNVLIEAYQANPSLFTQQYSTSEYVDILDEIKFGLDYLMKTMPEDGEFIIQLSTGLDHVGIEQWRLPEHDTRDGKREALSALSPSHMAATAAALAGGAKIFVEFDPVLAEQYRRQAVAIYNRSLAADVLKQNAFERDSKNDFYRDEDVNNERALAAAQLFALTDDPSYQSDALAYAKEHGQFIVGGKKTSSGLDYYFSLSDSILMAYKVLAREDNTAKHMGKIELDSHLTYANTEGNIWGTAQIPNWGSLSNMLYIAGTAAEDLVDFGDAYYTSLAYDNIDYLLGRNPWGISFVNATSLSKVPSGFHSQIYHLQADKQPIGVIANGPSQYRYILADKDIEIDPDAWENKFNTSYIIDGIDQGIVFFDSWKNYTGTEPTIFGQATGIYALAAMTKLEEQGIKESLEDERRPAMKSPPSNLPVDKVPMFVTIGSDDNESSAGVKWLYEMVNSYSNPAGRSGRNNLLTFDGDTARLTFLNTGVNASKAGAEWKNAHAAGNETGNHTQTHNPNHHGSEMQASQWLDEIQQAHNSIVSVGIAGDEIYGFRAPRLEYNDALFSTLHDQHFLYDSSIEDGYARGLDGSNFHWPYTLDAGSPGAILKTTWDQAAGTPFIIGAYPGLWELPVSPWIVPDDLADGLPYDLRAKIKTAMSYFDMEGGKITAFDYNLLVSAKLDNADDIYAILKHTLDLRLKGNRAPMVIGAHSKNYSSPDSPMAVALKRFVEYALTHQDVRIVSHKQVIDWMSHPRALEDIPHIVSTTVKAHIKQDQCTDALWQASTVYTKGTKVTFEGATWTAAWWNENVKPGASEWGPWGKTGVPCNGETKHYYGTISPQGLVAVDDNSSQRFEFLPEPGKKLAEVKIDGVIIEPVPVDGYTIVNVREDHTITATFNDNDDIDDRFTITSVAGPNGAINPQGEVKVSSGDEQLYTLTASDGFVLDTLLLNGQPVIVADNQYLVKNITVNTRVEASFRAQQQPNRPPTAVITGSNRVNSGASLTLSAESSSDPDGHALSYQWQLPENWSANAFDTATITVTAPNVSEGSRSDNITLTVADSEFSNTVTHTITVTAISPCAPTDPNADQHPAWSPDSIYTENTVVSHKDLVWQAKYWTQGDEPTRAADQWLLISQVTLAWDESTAYSQGDTANDEGQRWQAKWWSKGEKPGTTDAWVSIGDNSCHQ
ncbi:polysaccharide deacetylase [Sinobacterium caligoides]|uniref:Polysaccharide deacetylase n=1 Tax=Sinobacterium caligoides TaxID=933926 RepID=A0A3N2E0F6_9GAMM|nr:glycoside hydrolase family 9 protein [Sinobacterium caligoides]ROS05574.1 polysaccharide deacetylase [Sinobacterium caligoides]